MKIIRLVTLALLALGVFTGIAVGQTHTPYEIVNDLRELEDIDLTAFFRLTPESCGKITAIIHLSDTGLDSYLPSYPTRGRSRLDSSLEAEYDICLIDPQLGWEKSYYLVFDITGGSWRTFADNYDARLFDVELPRKIGYSVLAIDDEENSYVVDWGTRADGAYYLFLPFAKQIEVDLVLSDRPIAETVTLVVPNQ